MAEIEPQFFACARKLQGGEFKIWWHLCEDGIVRILEVDLIGWIKSSYSFF